MQLDFLIFDLDGTIIDSELDVASALNRLMGDFQIEPFGRAVIREHVGYGIKPLIERALAGKGITDTESAFAAFTDYYLEHCVRETKLYADVAPTLEKLGTYRKTILTNKSNRFIGKILAGLDLGMHFEGAYGRESFARIKPDPLPILSILESAGVAKERALMIGDTETDILAGQNAGVKTCLVTYGYGREAALSQLKPDFVIRTFSDLVPLLARTAVRPGDDDSTGL